MPSARQACLRALCPVKSCRYRPNGVTMLPSSLVGLPKLCMLHAAGMKAHCLVLMPCSCAELLGHNAVVTLPNLHVGQVLLPLLHPFKSTIS